jgi:hypothetical protein
MPNPAHDAGIVAPKVWLVVPSVNSYLIFLITQMPNPAHDAGIMAPSPEEVRRISFESSPQLIFP